MEESLANCFRIGMARKGSPYDNAAAESYIKTITLFRKLRYIGVEKIARYFTLGLSVFNLVRMRSLGVAAS